MSSTNVTGVALVQTPSQTANLVASIVQATVFVSLGPFVTIYGPAILHIVTIIRSLFAMNYLSFINSVSSVNRMTAFSVFTDQIAVLAAGTIAMAIATLRARRLRAYTAGAVLGTMIATPLVALIRNELYFGPVGCTGFGEKTVTFPEGMPIGCDQDSDAFQVTFQLTKALTVGIVVGFALIGQKTMGFSIALMGATMLVSGALDLIEVIVLYAVQDQALMKTITQTFGVIELPVTYGIAALGYFVQWFILKNKDDLRYTAPELYVEDTEEITKLKEELKAVKPEAQESFGKFFKATFKREKLKKKIRKKVKVNYLLNGKKPMPYREAEVLTRQPEEMQKFPFKLFVCFISGKMDDRLHKMDMVIKNIMLDDDGFDPAVLKAMIIANLKAMVKRKAKEKLEEKKKKTLGKTLSDKVSPDTPVQV